MFHSTLWPVRYMGRVINSIGEELCALGGALAQAGAPQALSNTQSGLRTIQVQRAVAGAVVPSLEDAGVSREDAVMVVQEVADNLEGVIAAPASTIQ